MSDDFDFHEFAGDGLTEPPAPQIPESQKVSRRSALTEFGVMVAPFVAQMSGLFSGGKGKSRPLSSEKGDYPYTDARHSLKEGGTLRNIGVRHSSEDATIDREFLHEAIDEADVVSIEGGERELSYFAALREYAVSKGKILYDGDYHRRALLEAQYATGLLIPAGIGTINALDDLANCDRETQVTRKGSRRSLLRAIAGVSALSFLPTYIGSDPGADGPYPKDTVSYVVDGRTVKMLTNLDQMEQEFPGKKIVSITGYVHAKGIEYYRDHPEEYEQKKADYDATYERVYGLEKKRLN